MQATTPTIFEEPTTISRPDESRFAMDNNLYIEFMREPVMHPAKSRDAGRAVYEERDFVRIHVPGDKSTVCVEPMHELNRQRFAARYQKWLAGHGEAVTGTPLSALPGMTPTKVEEYKYFKIVTVEQMAEANDQLGQKFMSFNADKQRAKAFLEVAAGNAPIERMNEELKKRDADIEELRAQVAALTRSAGKRKVDSDAEAA